MRQARCKPSFAEATAAGIANSDISQEHIVNTFISQATEQVVRRLAELAGETVQAAVRRAAEERLHQVQQASTAGASPMEIARRCAALPDVDRRSAGEILGYDEHGMPS
jgi:antitoxin VapB